MEKILIIIQARQTSKRFKNKVLKNVYKKLSIIELMYKRLYNSRYYKNIIFAIPNNDHNLLLKETLIKKKIRYFLGDENDVLKRYYLCAKKFKAKHIVRLTADCPLIDGKTLDRHISYYFNNHTKGQYLTNQLNRTFPDGYDIEIFSRKLLNFLNTKTKLKEDREHVTLYLKRNYKNILHFNYKNDLSKYRVTLDYESDLIRLKRLLKYFGNLNFSFKDLEKYLIKKNHSKFKKEVGQDIWKEAKKLMPPGSSLYSKNPDIFLPDIHPVYYQKAKGCFIWSLGNKKYIDFSYMGVGTSLLGYANEKVDKYVINAIKKGSNTTLNNYEEVELSKKIINLHPWFDGVKFAKGGAESNNIALRLARSYNSKENIAICGYHGWHDWYLSSNLKKGSLDKVLFPDVKIKGVSKKLKNTSHIFKFNDIEDFKRVMRIGNFTAVIMEIKRNLEPKKTFLNYIKKYCNKKNIVLIYDECSSGFRETNGGIHKKYKVYPDIAMFSKCIGNGYPISVLAGKKNIINQSNKTFISSTYWSERIGSVAALATIKEMERIKSWKIINKKGLFIRKKIMYLAKKNKIKLILNDSVSIINFSIIGKYNSQVYKNFITQEMLKKYFLANTTIYVSIAHTKKIILNYLKKLDSIFKKINQKEKEESLYSSIQYPLKNYNLLRFN